MMMGGRSSKNLLDFLSNPSKAQIVIAEHKQAVEAHARAADDYKRKKAEALETLEHLRKKQVEHDVRHADLDKIKQHLDAVGALLDIRKFELDQKHDELVHSQAKLQQQNVEQQQIFKRMTEDILNKDQRADQKHRDLDQKLIEAEKHSEELRQREILLVKREKAIKDLAAKL